MRWFYFWYSRLNSKPILISKILDNGKIAQPDFKYKFNIRIPYIRTESGRLKIVESISSNFKHQKDLNYIICHLSYLGLWSNQKGLLTPPAAILDISITISTILNSNLKLITFSFRDQCDIAINQLHSKIILYTLS